MCHCPLSVLRDTTYVHHCGHGVPGVWLSAAGRFQSCFLPCPHFARSMHLFPVAYKRPLPSVMIPHLFAAYKPPKLVFLGNPPKVCICCKIILRKTFSIEYPGTGCFHKFCKGSHQLSDFWNSSPKKGGVGK